MFSPGRYSVHEGQVLLTVNYPSNMNLDGKLLDSSLVRMLELQGKVYAWHKFPAKEVSAKLLSNSATANGTFQS
jgi:hypothetical protein